MSRIPTADEICREHYTSPPKPSTYGKCPIARECHSGGNVADWLDRIENAARRVKEGVSTVETSPSAPESQNSLE